MPTDASTYAHFLFNAFDMDRNGSIHFEDFVIGLSVLLRGSVTEKLNWAFNLYDINKDGYITKEVNGRGLRDNVLMMKVAQKQNRLTQFYLNDTFIVEMCA